MKSPIVILDIGAGSKYFARRLWWNNLRLKLLIFCGEPNWRTVFCGVPNNDQVSEIIINGSCDIHLVTSSYNSFQFDHSSLNMITINAPHPFMMPHGIEEEIIRCLKVGGIVFYSYPTKLYSLKLPKDDFQLIGKDRFLNTSTIDLGKHDLFPSHLPTKITPSMVVKSSIVESEIRQKMPTLAYRSPSYLYSNMKLCPSYELWRRIK